jgi:hypothetical protein
MCVRVDDPAASPTEGVMRTLATAVCCALACTVAGLTAQGGATAQDTMKKEMKEVTVTGCVSEGAGGRYMLTDATMGGDMKSETKAAMKPMSFNLMGGELKGHVGHKVEVSGTMDPGKMKHDTMDEESMEKAAKDKMAVAGDIDVKSVKMISATCP